MDYRLADSELKPMQEEEVIELLNQPNYLRVAMINARDGTSAAQFKHAFNNPEFRTNMANLLPNTVMSPHLFKIVAVPDICVE
jgi:hypothetical protein